jgi:hypothetical protein
MRSFWFATLLLASTPCRLGAQALPHQKVDFTREVLPLLESRCFPCHGSQLQLHGLRLDRAADALKGGDSGTPAIVPGRSADSLLVRYVSGQDPKIVMPPAGARLTSEQVALLRAWIDQGAEWPATATGADARADRARRHWAFQPRTRPEVPRVRGTDRVRNPIDAFVLARLEARGWQAAPPSSPRQLLRRVHLDLLGTPPTLAEQEAFLKDPSPEAADRIVDELLGRPAYGERWGRHWLDLVRYAETNGYERDATKPFVWKYRDYVIRSFIEDKPFDRFVLEQLAGDELPAISPETLIATGYYRLGPWDDEPADPQTDRFDQLDDIVSTTAQVFLGLTLGCARCHDHKFEPLTARDYYGMVAVFNGLERPQRRRTELDLPVGTRDELRVLAERDRRIEPIEAAIARLAEAARRTHLESGGSKLPPEAVRAFLAPAEKRTEAQKALVGEFTEKLDAESAGAMSEAVRTEIRGLRERIAELRRATPDLPRGYFLREPKVVPPPTHLLIRGKATQPGPEVAPAVPAVLLGAQPEFGPGGETSLRRRALARWIASPGNPLTARVIVNRVWQKHFGEGLVRTPSDFGVMGQPPTHPELLDWLANWFVDEGWSLKKLHRLILTSNTYRMGKRGSDAPAAEAAYFAQDPENRLLWRFPYTRLEAEAIRDSMLAVSGRLNRRMFGPSMYPEIPEAALAGHSDPGKIWKVSDEEERSRRTVYAFLKRAMIVPLLEVLDLCDTTRTSPVRTTTSVAPQALTLFNGEFVNRQARFFAARLISEVGEDARAQIDRAFRLALARPPEESETRALLEFLKSTAAGLAGSAASEPQNDRLKALEEMCRVIFNLNEFVYPD